MWETKSLEKRWIIPHFFLRHMADFLVTLSHYIKIDWSNLIDVILEGNMTLIGIFRQNIETFVHYV